MTTQPPSLTGDRRSLLAMTLWCYIVRDDTS